MDHKDLKIWRRSRDLCISVYKATETLPDSEKFGISSQIQRAAVSVPSNIAEGYRRNSPKDFIRFLNIASGSLAELETQLDICREIYETEVTDIMIEIIEIQKMISGFQKNLRDKE